MIELFQVHQGGQTVQVHWSARIAWQGLLWVVSLVPAPLPCGGWGLSAAQAALAEMHFTPQAASCMEETQQINLST